MNSDKSKYPPPETFAPQPGWVEIGDAFAIPRFVSGEPDGDRLRVRYFRRESDNALVGRVWFGPGTEGPPGHAHGGSMAALLDEVMGASAWIVGHTVVAAKIEIDFRKMLPLGTVASVEGHVHEVSGRKVTTHAQIFGPDHHVFANGQGLFIKLDTDAFPQQRGYN